MASRELTWTKFSRKLSKCFVLLVFIQYSLVNLTEQANDEKKTDFELLKPTIFVAVLVRNKAHTLPWFFGHLEHLDYPKDRIALW